MSNHTQDIFSNAKGYRLNYHLWATDGPPRGYVMIAHGIGEHAGRYGHVAAAFNEIGFNVFGPDHQGHGRSQGKRGHISRFEYYCHDLEQLRQLVVGENDRKPFFLLGHSMGGLIACVYLSMFQDKVDGAILSAPAVGIQSDVSPLQFKIAKTIHPIFPSLTLNNSIDAALLSHDSEEVEKYKEDKLVHPRISLRLFFELLRSGESCLPKARKIKTPILLMVGDDDQIIDIEKAKLAFDQLPNPDSKIVIFEDMYHEIFNEIDRDRVIEYAKTWLQTQIAETAQAV